MLKATFASGVGGSANEPFRLHGALGNKMSIVVQDRPTVTTKLVYYQIESS